MTARVPARVVALAAATLALALGFFLLRPAPTGGPPMRDFESYWAAGRVVDARPPVSPYGRAVWTAERTIPGVDATRDEALPFVGPPYGLPLWWLLGRLSFADASILWGAVLALSLATIVAGAAILVRARDGWDVAAIALVAGVCGPLTSGTGLGQVAIVATAATVLAALLVASGGRSLRTALGLAASALVAALQPNLAIVLAALATTPRRIAAFAAAAALALGATLVIPSGGLARYLALLHDHGDAERFIAIQTTPAAIARGLGVAAPVAVIVGDCVTLGVVALVFVQLLGRRTATPLERYAIAAAALPLALPFSHEHDLTIALVPALLAVRRARDAATIALATIGTLLVEIDWIGLAQRPTGVAETAAFAAAAALGVAVLGGGETAPDVARRAAGLAVVPLVLALGATTHRLPTWPDALPPGFHVAPEASITALWLAEQVRCGIAALDPWWAGLRGLSLVGCALVWAATLRISAPSRSPRASDPSPQQPREPREPRASHSGPASIHRRPARAAHPSTTRTP